MVTRADVENFIRESDGDPGVVLASVEALALETGYSATAVKRLLDAVVDDLESYHHATETT